MDANHINIIEKINGVPMISEKFGAQSLITFAAHHRHMQLLHYDVISNYIIPEKIEHLYHARNLSLGIEYPESTKLECQEHQAVANAIEQIQRVMPEWRIYFSLPVQFKKMTENQNVVSLTNHQIPQTIFLGEKAFESESWLQEIIIHEFSHIWLGLVCEIDSFHDHLSKNEYELPSGTKNKDARGVIFASHFSACVITFLRKKSANGILSTKGKERLNILEKYFSGCMTQLITMEELTTIGKNIVDIMGDEIHHG